MNRDLANAIHAEKGDRSDQFMREVCGGLG